MAARRPAGTASRSAFACDSPADVDATFDALVGAGATGHLAPRDAFWGQRYAVVLDPDGNHVDLFAVLPGWRQPRQRHARQILHVAGEVRLVGVAGACGRVARTRAVAHEGERVLEPEDAMERLRGVPERRRCCGAAAAGR